MEEQGFRASGSAGTRRPVPLEVGPSLWTRVFTVAPLVLVGTREAGGYDLAPKHMAMPLGWGDRFCFVCTPRHATYWNAKEHGTFTVSFPGPEHVVPASMAAAGRYLDGAKPSLSALATFPATQVDGVLVEDCPLHLECELEQIVDVDEDTALVVGRIVAALADPEVLRDEDADDSELLARRPLLAFVSPGRFARVAETFSFPFPADFSR
jgi:flavin reductase (DIM6/NTAB) family NADH-FMN oxidoreductase RutF